MDIQTIKANYQEVLKRKIEEQQAEAALRIINEFEEITRRQLELAALVSRLEDGEAPESVLRDLYGKNRVEVEYPSLAQSLNKIY